MTDQTPARTSIFAGQYDAVPYEAEPRANEVAESGPEKATRRRHVLGPAALAAVLLLAVVEGVAVTAGATGDYPLATSLAWVVIIGTVGTLLLGIIAVVAGRGRWWGLAAAVISILVNPLALMRILDFFGTVTTS